MTAPGSHANSEAPSDTAPTRVWLTPRGQIVALLVWLGSTWIFAATAQLVPDEAYYWVWSRHLSWSYLDHPPMVAWLIRLGTLVAGPNELGVRWLNGLLAACTVLMLTFAAQRLWKSTLASGFTFLMLLVSPLISLLGSIVTPDTPACFFQTAALLSAVWIFEDNSAANSENRALNQKVGKQTSLLRGPRWIFFGLLIGLAMISKYTSVLTALAVLAVLVITGDGRRHLRTIWPWLGAIASVLVFSPVIYWNKTHGWASFNFQLHHGLSGSDHGFVRNELDFVGSQLAVCTPVLFILLILALIHFLRRKPAVDSFESNSVPPKTPAALFVRPTPMQMWLLLFATLAPLIFFAYSSVHRRIEANWPIFAYMPGTLLVAGYIAERPLKSRLAWGKVAIQVAFVGTVLIHVPTLIWKINPKWSTPQWEAIFGWRELAHDVSRQAGDSPVYSIDYEYASEMQFYLPNQPQVWPLRGDPRPTAYDFFSDRPDPSRTDRLVVVRSRKDDTPDALDVISRQQFGQMEFIHFQIFINGRMIRRSMIIVASGMPAVTEAGTQPVIRLELPPATTQPREKSAF